MADNEILKPEALYQKIEDGISTLDVQIGKLYLNGNTRDTTDWLQNIESPFNWLQVRFPDVSSKEVITKVTERTEMVEGLNDNFPFEKFVGLLTLVFELSCQGEEKLAWTNFKLCEELLEEEKIKDLKPFSYQCEALNHALQGTKAHLLFLTGKEAEAKQVVASLQQTGDMSVESLAAIQGLKAWFFHHFRGEGAQLALQCAHQALALEPDSPLWLLLTSQTIRRIRKLQPSLEEVSQKEMELLERAVAIKRSVRHLLMLAQAYREAGDSRFKKYRNEPDFFRSQTFQEISDMQAKAFELYREVLSLQPDSEVVNRLCGYGMLKLPEFKSDYRLAEQCLQRALEQDPTNATTIHAIGLHYYKGLMDYEKAALFCEKAGKLGNFPASLDMLRMKRLVYGSNYDPVFDFQKLLKQYGDDQTKKHEILCQMGSYYLFFERNVIKAMKYFKTLIEENAELSIITCHKCTFLNMACKINLFKYIVNSGRHLQESKLNLAVEENGIEDLKTFLNSLEVTSPELFEVPINENLIDDLHKVSDDIKQTYIRKKERRDSLKQRRRSSLTDRRSSLDCNTLRIISRRQSESNLNFRRRSSGNMELIQNRVYQNLNKPNHKQFLKTSEEDLSRQRNYFHKQNEHHKYPGNIMFRRRSSGVLSDSGQDESLRGQPRKKDCLGRSECFQRNKETYHVTDKPLQIPSETGFDTSCENKMVKRDNNQILYKRNVSRSGGTIQEIQRNWRTKDLRD